MTDNDMLAVNGNSGQLFSITDSLEGTIFAVNDISGVPSIEVDDDGEIRLAETFGEVLIGTDTNNGVDILQVNGSTYIAETLHIGDDGVISNQAIYCPTPSANDNSTKVATTAYVDNAVGGGVTTGKAIAMSMIFG